MHASRYDRQQRFAPIGAAGQQKIERARVLVIGVGALGSVIAELLARAGVGYLRLVDRDTVDWSNLQRQALYTEADAAAGLAKVQAAAKHLSAINSSIEVQPIAADVTAGNISELAAGLDLIIDGTDNFEIRFLINDVAWENGIPWIHGGCLGASGQVFAFRPGKTICFRCLVPTVPDPNSLTTCDAAGVLGPATHTIASLQAMEALKTLVLASPKHSAGDSSEILPGSSKGNSAWDSLRKPSVPLEPLVQKEPTERQRLVSVDLWAGRYRSLETAGLRNPTCPCCGLGKREFLRGDAGPPAPTVLCGRNAVQLPPLPSGKVLQLPDFAEAWKGLGEIHQSRFLVRLNLPDDRSITLFKDGRAVIGGTEDPMVARALFAQFVGG